VEYETKQITKSCNHGDGFNNFGRPNFAKKSQEIVINPHRYKNLRAPLNHWKRVHIDNHFVLTFSIDEDRKTIILEDYDHHDNIYK